MEEKMQLKEGLASALEHKRGLESGLQAASEELVDLQIRVSTKAAIREASTCLAEGYEGLRMS